MLQKGFAMKKLKILKSFNTITSHTRSSEVRKGNERLENKCVCEEKERENPLFLVTLFFEVTSGSFQYSHTLIQT